MLLFKEHTLMSKLDENAIELRRRVRAKANLSVDLDQASDDMKNWYRDLASRLSDGKN